MNQAKKWLSEVLACPDCKRSKGEIIFCEKHAIGLHETKWLEADFV